MIFPRKNEELSKEKERSIVCFTGEGEVAVCGRLKEEEKQAEDKAKF